MKGGADLVLRGICAIVTSHRGHETGAGVANRSDPRDLAEVSSGEGIAMRNMKLARFTLALLILGALSGCGVSGIF